MWLNRETIKQVDRVAQIYYMNSKQCAVWNRHRKEGELRLLTGWCWRERRGANLQQGLKTQTACYRDAWYALVVKQMLPATSRLRVVGGSR